MIWLGVCVYAIDREGERGRELVVVAMGRETDRAEARSSKCLPSYAAMETSDVHRREDEAGACERDSSECVCVLVLDPSLY